MSAAPGRRQLRETFEQDAEAYDRARPGYPDAVFDDLVALARLPQHGRILEIGCGTGQATVPLAERGLGVVALELGPNLAAIARRKLGRFAAVEVVNAEFESWEAPEAAFDAVAAFTAFHWIDPELRYRKPALLLRADGVLAVVATNHVDLGHGGAFWSEVQEDYDAVTPSDDNRPPPHPAQVPDLRAQIERSGLFTAVAVRRHLWEVDYDADAYIALLDTYSGHRVLAKPQRLELYERIRRRIEGQPRGRVLKTYLATLNVARLA